jgi:hypothetical protein
MLLPSQKAGSQRKLGDQMQSPRHSEESAKGRRRRI